MSEGYVPSYSVEVIAIISLIEVLIITITVIGNVFVILAYIRNSRIRTKVGNLFILNLAITDFLIGAFSLTFNLTRFIKSFWPLGEIICKLWLVLDYTASWASVITMGLISWDRYCLVSMGLKYKTYQTKKRVGPILIFVWTFGIIFFSFLTFAWSSMTGQSNVDYDETCRMEFIYSSTATVFINLISFDTLLIMTIIMNYFVYVNIRRRSKRGVSHRSSPYSNVKIPTPISNTTTKKPLSRWTCFFFKSSNGREQDPENNTSPAIDEIQNVEATGSKREETAPDDIEMTFPNTIRLDIQAKKERIRLAKHFKAFIVLSILTGCFVLFWTPYKVMTVVFSICGTDCTSTVTWEVLEVSAWCNSTINPFIYAATNVRFRNNFRHFLLLDRCSSDANHCKVQRKQP